MRSPASDSPWGLLLLVSLGVACGRAEPGAAVPRSEPAAAAPLEKNLADPGQDAELTEPAVARVDLVAEFHRTRVGGGGGFWVLGMIANPHSHPVTDVRPRVKFLDAEGEVVGDAQSQIPQPLAAGARVAVAVLVAEPVEHDQLTLLASAVGSDAQLPPALPLKLEHEPPLRADLGGWFVVGSVTNTSDELIEAVRLEIQGLDRAGKLLGVDWLVLDSIPAQQTIEFDVGDLRYDEPPHSFALKLRRETP
ncbi:FxLYD domain-containing protein [Enhygromyxa salina]|uniref:Lipoprotein n=1 Tax=Enhygromyxa salina TaxID=215803 RepID=A0A2S9YDG4_9BACT|nr:FxLYD domain-containing protein [Enhygromyxa salina]PRQ03135.1 hypothetical protein ENSA7_54060 [Enhygromyxa salina]